MRRNRRSDRAQTSIDFAIAMGVFLVALTTVIAFMPTMIQPFTGGQENPLVADRVASQLTDDQLGDPNTPSVLNTTCTMYFFNGTTPDPCPAFDNSEPLTEKVNVDDTRFINVTLRRDVSGGPDPDIVCAHPDGSVSAPSCTGSDETFAAVGPSPPDSSGSVTTARRASLYGEDTVYVVVKVWT